MPPNATAPQSRPDAGTRFPVDWETRVSRSKQREAASFFDGEKARDRRLPDRLYRAMEVLDNFAGVKPYCFPSNQELEGSLGKALKTIQAILADAEAEGLMRRVTVPGRSDLVTGRECKTGRLGFVLFWRPSKNPAATPETFDQVADRLRRDLKDREDRFRRRLPFKTPSLEASNTARNRDRLHLDSGDSCTSIPGPDTSKEDSGKEKHERTTTTEASLGTQAAPETVADPSSSDVVSFPPPGEEESRTLKRPALPPMAKAIDAKQAAPKTIVWRTPSAFLDPEDLPEDPEEARIAEAEAEASTIRRLMAALRPHQALDQVLAESRIRDWVARDGGKRVLCAVSVTEARKDSPNPIRSEGGVADMLRRWRGKSDELVLAEAEAIVQPRIEKARAKAREASAGSTVAFGKQGGKNSGTFGNPPGSTLEKRLAEMEHAGWQCTGISADGKSLGWRRARDNAVWDGQIGQAAGVLNAMAEDVVKHLKARQSKHPAVEPIS